MTKLKEYTENALEKFLTADLTDASTANRKTKNDTEKLLQVLLEETSSNLSKLSCLKK